MSSHRLADGHPRDRRVTLLGHRAGTRAEGRGTSHSRSVQHPDSCPTSTTALASTPDIFGNCRHRRRVPILLQKSAYRGSEAADAIF